LSVCKLKVRPDKFMRRMLDSGPRRGHMPEIVCPSCGARFSIEEVDYDGEASCPSCKALLHIVISQGEIEEVELIEEGYDEESWLEDEDLWETEEEEGEEIWGLEEEDFWEEE